VIVGERSTGSFIREAYLDMLSGAPGEATHDLEGYRFTARVTRPGTYFRPAEHAEATLAIKDGPGGALFPNVADAFAKDRRLSELEDALIEDAAAATCLVLCVDCSNAETDLLLSQLPDRLRDVSSRTAPANAAPAAETWGQRLYRRWQSFRRVLPRQRLVAERWLNADRFLVLLTKVDVLAEHVASAHDLAAGAPAGTPPPSAIAAAIDPVWQARALLGEVFLQQILSALRPGAQLAVGLTSARGFDADTGQPFRVRPWAGSEQGPPDEESARGLKDWAPFGLRDAVVFMVRGEVGEAVRLVDEAALFPESRQRMRPTSEQIAHRVSAEQARRSWR
jgi:hypothetical protein